MLVAHNNAAALEALADRYWQRCLDNDYYLRESKFIDQKDSGADLYERRSGRCNPRASSVMRHTADRRS